MFYSPATCGGCDRAPQDFGESFLPHLALGNSGQAPITIYLCNSCIGIVRGSGTIILTEQVQYHVRQTKVIRRDPYGRWWDQPRTATEDILSISRRMKEEQEQLSGRGVPNPYATNEAKADYQRALYEYLQHMNRNSNP